MPTSVGHAGLHSAHAAGSCGLELVGLAGRGWSGLWGACAHPEPAVARVRAEKLALGVAVERVPAGDRRADHAVDLRLVDEGARVQQRRLGDADVRDKVAVGVLDQRAAKEQVPVGPARDAAHEAHGDLRARRVEAARVGVRRVHVGAHAHRAVARVHGVVARLVDKVEVVVLVVRPPRARVRRARRLGARRLAHEPVEGVAALARVRVKLGVVRAHEVASVDRVLAAAAVAVEVGVAADHEARAPDVAALGVERGHVAARRGLAVRLAAGDAPARHARAIDAILHERRVLLRPRIVGRRRLVLGAVGAPLVGHLLALVARLQRRDRAQHRQPERAPPRAHEVARRRARALGRAAVARELAARDARREVGAARLDVGARLGRQPLARKLDLAKPAVVARHVLEVVDARAVRARGVGRAVVRFAVLGDAVGAHLEQLLAQLAIGRERVDLRVPIPTKVALARLARRVAAALDPVEGDPRVGRLVRVEPAHDARGPVGHKAAVEVGHERVATRLQVPQPLLEAPRLHEVGHLLGRRGRRAHRNRRRRRRRVRRGREHGDGARGRVDAEHRAAVLHVLPKREELVLRVDLRARGDELVLQRLAHAVALVVFEEHARVAAVGAHGLDVGCGAGGHGEVDGDLEVVAHLPAWFGRRGGGGWAKRGGVWRLGGVWGAPAAIIASNMSRSESAASTSTRQRGSKGMPSTSSPGRMVTPQSPFRFSRFSPSSGTG